MLCRSIKYKKNVNDSQMTDINMRKSLQSIIKTLFSTIVRVNLRL